MTVHSCDCFCCQQRLWRVVVKTGICMDILQATQHIICRGQYEVGAHKAQTAGFQHRTRTNHHAIQTVCSVVSPNSVAETSKDPVSWFLRWHSQLTVNANRDEQITTLSTWSPDTITKLSWKHSSCNSMHHCSWRRGICDFLSLVFKQQPAHDWLQRLLIWSVYIFACEYLFSNTTQQTCLVVHNNNNNSIIVLIRV